MGVTWQVQLNDQCLAVMWAIGTVIVATCLIMENSFFVNSEKNSSELMVWRSAEMKYDWLCCDW